MAIEENQRCAFVCRGPWCADRGSKQIKEELARQLAAEGDANAVRSYPCFGHCDRGPNIFVYPDGLWYAGVETGDLPELAAHLRGGPPVQRRQQQADRWYTRLTCANIEEVLNLQPSGHLPSAHGRFRCLFRR